VAVVRTCRLLRVSTKKQTKRGAKDEPDIPAQRQAIEEWVNQRTGWTHVREFIEPGVSAYKNSREDRIVLDQIFADARAGLFDVLVVWKGDRLSRRTDELPGIVRDLVKMGVAVWAVADAPGGKEWRAENAMDLLMLSLEGWKNEVYSEQISVNVKNAKRQQARTGTWTGGRAPYGYMFATKKDHNGEPVMQGGRIARELAPDPDTAPVVRSIFERYAAGIGGMALAEWLNKSGTPSPFGAKWSSNGVRYILQNKVYAGLLVYGRSPKGKKAVGEQIVAKGNHEPLIDQRLWDKVEQLRQARQGMEEGHRNGATYALSGILRCGKCHGVLGAAKMHYKLRTTGESRFNYGYRCHQYISSKGCVPTRYKDTESEAAFVKALANLPHAENLRSLLEQRAAASESQMKEYQLARRRAQDRIRVIDTALVNLKRGYLEAGTISDSEYCTTKAEYEAERAELERELSRPAPTDEARDLSELVTMVTDIEANWAVATPTERKALALFITTGWNLRAEIDPQTKEVTLSLQ
jgi:DNA invertase Pin-like site-specific DNA recombinase